MTHRVRCPRALCVAAAALVLWTGCDDDANEIDAGRAVDAGARPDARVVDGGMDAAMIDAALHDGGAVDGAVGDAALLDGAVDGGRAADAGKDGGRVDAGADGGATAFDDGGVDDAGVADDAAETAAVVSAIDQGEIAVARIAMELARDASVRAYADMMVEDHTAAEARLERVLAGIGITPRASDVSAQVSANATEARAGLEGLELDAFDAEYIETQVTMHAQALAILDTRLLRRTREPQLRAFLAELRGDIVQHLRMAQQIQRELARAARAARR